MILMLIIMEYTLRKIIAYSSIPLIAPQLITEVSKISWISISEFHGPLTKFSISFILIN